MNANDIFTIILLLPVMAIPVGLIIDLYRYQQELDDLDNQ